MKESISVSKKRLDLLLIPLCLFIYFKIYWFVYSFVAESLLSVLLELLSILDILFGAFFLFSAAPCSYLLRSLILKFLTNSPFYLNICTSTPPRVSIRAPQDRVTIWAKGKSSMRFALLSTATLPEPPILVVHMPAAIADSKG